MNKEPARKHIAQQVHAMSETQKRDASSRICEQLGAVASVCFADTILSYLPQENEISLLPSMQAGLTNQEQLQFLSPIGRTAPCVLGSSLLSIPMNL